MKTLFRRWLYRPLMKLAHRYHWHYAPPSYPDGDTHLWCQWCGFRQTIARAVVGSRPVADFAVDPIASQRADR